MAGSNREIGRIGTTVRVVVGLGLLYLVGGATVQSWGLESHDVIVGLIAMPAILLAIGLAANRYANGPLRFMGPAGIAANCALIVALVANPYTGGGATLFYGATILIAALRGQPGCELTVVSNAILGRDDQVGCPTFAPVDGLEARMGGRSAPATVSS